MLAQHGFGEPILYAVASNTIFLVMHIYVPFFEKKKGAFFLLPLTKIPLPFLQQQRTFIQMRTVLKVVDNSGAKKVMCIQALKGKKGARLGDTIIASVKEAHPNGKVKKGKVVYGVVVRAAMPKGRCDGSEVKFDDNAVVLVDKQGQPIGTRVFGPVPHELRQKKHVKILTLAGHIA